MSDLSGEPTVSQWQNGVRIMHIAHIEAAKSCRRRHRLLGVVAVLLGGVSATAVFKNLADNPIQSVQVAAGGVTLLAARCSLLAARCSLLAARCSLLAVTAVMTFLDYGKAAADHQTASVGYGSLRRELEVRVMATEVPVDYLHQVGIRWSDLDRDSPTVPAGIYARSSRLVLGTRRRIPILTTLIEQFKSS